MLAKLKKDRNVDYDYHWRRFSTETSIHGVIYLSKKQKNIRWIWIPILLATLTLCVWQSVINIRDYFSFNVITKVTYSTDDNVEFPAITFWNSNILRRTVIGRRLESKMLLAYKFGLDIQKVNKTCDYKPHQVDDIDTKIDTFLKTFSSNSDNMLTQDKVDELLELLIVNQKMTFEKCWLKNQETDCDLVVLNSLIDTNHDITPSYSVNMDPKTAELFRGNQSLGISLKNEKYQVNRKVKNWYALNPSNGGYKFLLNVNEEEYCMYKQDIWYGVGLHATIHGRRSFPMEVDDRGTVYLKPGFHYNLVLKPKHYQRNTEHLGKCLSSSESSYLLPTAPYAKQVCQFECINEIIWKSCRCISLVLPQLRKAIETKHDVHENQTVPCWANDDLKKCYTNLGVFDDNFNKEHFCPHCKQPCEETIYNFDLTATRFPPQHLAKDYIRMLNISYHKSLQQNYLMINVFFESKSVNLIEDNQAYSGIDLFIFIGNNIGLFLGMSFMSFHELFHHSAQLVVDVIQRRTGFPKLKQKIKLNLRKIPNKIRSVIKKFCLIKLGNRPPNVVNKRRSTVTTLQQIRSVKVRPSLTTTTRV